MGQLVGWISKLVKEMWMVDSRLMFQKWNGSHKDFLIFGNTFVFAKKKKKLNEQICIQ